MVFWASLGSLELFIPWASRAVICLLRCLLFLFLTGITGCDGLRATGGCHFSSFISPLQYIICLIPYRVFPIIPVRNVNSDWWHHQEIMTPKKMFNLRNLNTLKTTRSGLANYVERLIGQLCEITINVEFPSHDGTRRVDWQKVHDAYTEGIQ